MDGALDQMDLFAPLGAPVQVSPMNEHGVLTTPFEILELSGGPGITNLAEIRIAYDGKVYHWGISISTNIGGMGFAPAPKWEHCSPNRHQAVLDAVRYMQQRLDDYPSKKVQKIRHWLSHLIC